MDRTCFTQENILYTTTMTYLPEVVEVVLAVDPAVGVPFVQAVCLVHNVVHFRTVTEVERSLEQLQCSMLSCVTKGG